MFTKFAPNFVVDMDIVLMVIVNVLKILKEKLAVNKIYETI